MRRLLSVFIFVCLSGIVRGQTISPAGPLALCPGGSKILTVTGPKPGTTFQWLKNNSRIVNATSVSYTISAAGSYSVVLGGLAAVDTLGPVVVIIASVPVASFTFSPSATQCGNTPITFTSTSSGTGLSYVWQFSDPNSGANNMVATSAVSAVHKFKGNPGNGTQTFTVKLVATNSTGCKDSTTQQVTIKQVPGPTLDGTGQIPFQGTIYFTQCGTTASLFSFTNQSAYPSSSNYKIIWGDTAADFDSPTFPPVLNHLYEVGNYTLKFIFTGINGCPDTTIYGVFVGDAPYGGIGTDNNQLSGCTGTVLSFPFLDAVFTNPAGTFYYLSVDDGTPVTVYNQPPPASFSHQFNNPSCGVGGNNSNAFTVSVLITNPCSISGVRGTISPIKISQTPSANFNIAKDTLCVNQTTTITDISANNFINQAGLCVLGKSVWSITPGVQNVDWTIVSGSLGNYNNSSVPSTWTAGSSVLNLRFINPGSYTVKLKTGGSDKCGIDSISKSICVNPLPKINFSFSSDTLCASLTDTVLYTPSTEYCGKNMYEWYVTKYTPAAGCFPNTSSYTYVDGTSDTSANPHFKFSSPGTYQIQLFAYSPGRACFNQMVKNVVVKGVPSISLPANAGVCQNQPLGFSNTVSCYTGSASYNWMFPGSSTPSSNLANPPPVSYANAGMYTITVGVTNECGTSTSVQKLIVDTLVLAYAGPDTTLCGSSVAMSANSPGIANGKWSVISGPNTPAITSPSSPSTTITGLVQGTYIFQWKISNGGCADSSTVTIKISGGPSIANAGPDQQLCLDTVATFAANTPAIGIGKWSFISGPNTPVIANMASAISVVNNLIPGVYTFTWTINFSNCSPNIDTIRITIYDSPTVADAGADQTICVSSTTLKGNFPSTGTGQWFFINGPGLPVTTDSSLSSTTVTGLVSGTYNFRWNISNGACLASNDTVQVVVSTIANNTISGNQSVCINSIPATITGSLPTGGNGNYNYLWQQSKDSTITWTDIAGATNASYSPGTLTQDLCFRRIVKTMLCPAGDPSLPLCITVRPDAQALFSVNQTTLCAPVNIDSLITVTPFPNKNLQYNWYQNNVLINSNKTGLPPSYLINTAGQTVAIKLITTSLFGCNADSMAVALVTLPSVNAGFTKDTISGCGPLSVNFTNTSSILNSTIEFYWDFGNGIKVSNVMQPANPVVYAPSPAFTDTTYYISLKAFSGCDTSIKRDSVKVFANAKARFTSIPTGCSPFRDTIINNSFGQDAFTVYYWDFGDNKRDTTFTLGELLHTYNTGIIDTFTIRLIAQNRCGRDTQYMDVVVSPNIIQPQVSINGSQLYGCAPHMVTFQNSSLGASLLYWDFGDSSLIEVTPNSQSEISHTYMKPGVYSIHITLQNDCTDTTIVKQITVYDPPLASFSLVNTLLCDGDAVFTNNTSTNANAYEWLWGDNTSTSAFNTSHIYSNAGIYNVRLVARKTNSFGSLCIDTSSIVPVNIVARIPAVIDISQAASCVPHTINVSAAGAAAAAKVDWYFYDTNVSPGIFHVAGPTAAYTYNNAGVDSVKLVIENKAGCSDSVTRQFTVYNTPLVIFSPLNAKTCNTDTVITFNVSLNYTGTDPVNYEWFINDQIAGNSNPFIYHFQAPAGVTASSPFNIKVLAKNSFGCGDTTLVGNFTIQTLAQQKIVVAPSVVQEQPNYTFTFTDTSQGLQNSTYLWSTGDRSGQQLPGKQITYTYGDTGTYHVKLLVQDFETGCSQTDSINVFVLAVPGYLYVPNAFCPGCQKAELRQFLPLAKGLKDYHLVIFNIWGQKVFETRGIDANGVPNEPWDGNWKSGNNIQQGAFSWYIEAHYINGSEWKGMMNPKTGKLQKQGFVSIIR